MDGKKKILFVLGANELAEHKDIIIDAVKKRIEIFRENADKIDVDVCLFPADREEWRRLDAQIADELFGLLDKAAADGLHITQISPGEAESAADKYDAYYGSPSYIPLHFCDCRKPVMIADMTV